MSSAWVTVAAGPMRSDVSGRTPYRRQSAGRGAGPPPPPYTSPLPRPGAAAGGGAEPEEPPAGAVLPCGARSAWGPGAVGARGSGRVPTDIPKQTSRTRRPHPQGPGSVSQRFVTIMLRAGTGPAGDPFFFPI